MSEGEGSVGGGGVKGLLVCFECQYGWGGGCGLLRFKGRCRVGEHEPAGHLVVRQQTTGRNCLNVWTGEKDEPSTAYVTTFSPTRIL